MSSNEIKVDGSKIGGSLEEHWVGHYEWDKYCPQRVIVFAVIDWKTFASHDRGDFVG